MNRLLSLAVPIHLVHLAPVDAVIVIFYFALVLAIGFYLKRRSNTSEDYFLAGREMTAWIAGLSSVSYTHLCHLNRGTTAVSLPMPSPRTPKRGP